MWYWNDGHMDGGWGVALMLGMIGFWVVVVVALLWIISSQRTTSAPPLAGPPVDRAAPDAALRMANAEQILAERLARGEIDPEEYRTRHDALASRGGP